MNESLPLNAPSSNEQGDAVGLRLRRARERAQWSVADVAARLKMAATLVDAMEREDFARFGAPIYARGYLASYLRLLNLPEVLVDKALRGAAVAAPVLQSAAAISSWRHYFDRYAMRSVYVVLTAAIIVPVIWLAVQRPSLVRIADVRSLDAPVTENASMASQPAFAASEAPHAATLTDQGSTTAGDSERETISAPVMATLTPFYSTSAPAPASADAATDVVPAEQPVSTLRPAAWSFRFRADSWVEFVGTGGRRLHFGIVPAGSEKQFAEGELTRVALGNADAVDVQHAGQSLNLAPFKRANVARFAISSEGAVALAERAGRAR